MALLLLLLLATSHTGVHARDLLGYETEVTNVTYSPGNTQIYPDYAATKTQYPPDIASNVATNTKLITTLPASAVTHKPTTNKAPISTTIAVDTKFPISTTKTPEIKARIDTTKAPETKAPIDTTKPTKPPVKPINFSNLASCDCPSYAQIYMYLTQLAQRKPHKVTLITNYKTYEGRAIVMVIVKPYMKSGVRNGRPNPQRKSYWMDGGLEANNCDTLTILLKIVDMLVASCPSGYCQNDYYIVPLVNPDGYEYARSGHPTWVKNRQPVSSDTRCKGTRINSNFPPNRTFYMYGSSNPCDSIFRGEYIASSQEATAIIKLKSSVPNLILANTFITYPKPLLVYPLAYSRNGVPEHYSYRHVAYKAVYAVHGVPGFPGLGYFTYYQVEAQSGTEMDFGYTQHENAFSYTFRIPLCMKKTSVAFLASIYWRVTAAMIDEISDL